MRRTFSGKEITLEFAYKWVRAFAQQGGSDALLIKTLEDPQLMQILVNTMKCPTLSTETQAFIAATEKGIVTEKEDTYIFEDPGLSLNELLALPILQNYPFIIPTNRWFAEYLWADTKRPPQFRRIRIPIPDSFGKQRYNWPALIEAGEEICSAREIVSFLAIYAVVNKSPLFRNPFSMVYCSDKDSEGHLVYIGAQRAKNMYISHHAATPGHSDHGLAASKPA